MEMGTDVWNGNEIYGNGKEWESWVRAITAHLYMYYVGRSPSWTTRASCQSQVVNAQTALSMPGS